MKYKIVHATEYFYSDPVPLSHNVLHLKPRDTPRQSRLAHSVVITPAPAARVERFDFFGNPITWFNLQTPHQSIKIVSSSEVEVKAFEPPSGLWWPSWEEVVRMLRERRQGELLDARQFTFESPYASIAPELADYARPSFSAARPLLDAVSELTQRIYKDFKFQAGATTVGTPVLEVLGHRRGVCQDFAHLQIACLRSLGLAARYVSGYLATRPPPGRPRLVGTDASHAWCSCFFPDFGWIDFDPTNGVIPNHEHVTLAWARDYSDVSPVRGILVGGHQHGLAVSVDVEPLSSGGTPARSALAPA